MGACAESGSPPSGRGYGNCTTTSFYCLIDDAGRSNFCSDMHGNSGIVIDLIRHLDLTGSSFLYPLLSRYVGFQHLFKNTGQFQAQFKYVRTYGQFLTPFLLSLHCRECVVLSLAHGTLGNSPFPNLCCAYFVSFSPMSLAIPELLSSELIFWRIQESQLLFPKTGYPPLYMQKRLCKLCKTCPRALSSSGLVLGTSRIIASRHNQCRMGTILPLVHESRIVLSLMMICSGFGTRKSAISLSLHQIKNYVSPCDQAQM